MISARQVGGNTENSEDNQLLLLSNQMDIFGVINPSLEVQMATVEDVKAKIQRLLTNRFGSVRIDKDGDFVVTNQSAVVFVGVRMWGDEDIIVSIRCPLIVDVEITDALCRWVAIDGQEYMLGSCWINPASDGKTGWVYFRTNILGNDLDESELFQSLDAVAFTGNSLDDELFQKFGGKMFGSN